ncbi:hypothetical protein Zmor_001980 [Zophobas morio]|uniref:Uncharacterized protein n=1 Tax=Zophobas morio TaxID=2755281 RepID=A0AA38IZS6_9CUCU|nr:hypothetical protein Zmor_001980 [Zophobas morio]
MKTKTKEESQNQQSATTTHFQFKFNRLLTNNPSRILNTNLSPSNSLDAISAILNTDQTYIDHQAIKNQIADNQIAELPMQITDNQETLNQISDKQEITNRIN